MGAAILVLISALTLTAVASLLTIHFFQRIPASQQASLAGVNLNNRFTEVFRGASAEARDGRMFWELATDLSRTVAPRAKAVQIPNNRIQAALAARNSQLGRLLAAGVVLSIAESEGRTPEQTWAAVKPYLEGLATAKFARFEPAHEALLSGVFRVGSVQAGTARQLAAELPEAYTPFLQYFVKTLNRCAADRAAAGDMPAAELCRKVKLRLLRDWTLEPGRTGTRLLAAELLGRELAGDPAAKTVSDAVASWRQAYRSAAKANPGGFLHQSSDPDLSGGIGRSVTALLVGSIGLAIATFVIAILGIAFAWPLLTRADSIGSRRAWVVGGLAAAIVVAVGLAILNSGFQAVQDDLNGAMQRMAAPAAPLHKSASWLPVYWARLPWNAAALGTLSAVVAIAGGRLVFAAKQRCTAASVAICWLLLAATWVGIAAWGVTRISTYESRIDAAYQRGVIATMLGDTGDTMLAPLRDWQP